jgi:hypothetical protein
MSAINYNQSINLTDNDAVAHKWSDLDGRSAVVSVFNISRLPKERETFINNPISVWSCSTEVCQFINLLPTIWNYNNKTFISLMFYLRNIRKATLHCTKLQKGKGERMLSYYMAIWLLEHHEDVFILNCRILIEDLGYFKDCLNMARIAKDRNMTDHQINLILYPMASALMLDESKIIKSHLSGNPDVSLELSLAHKWAPRQGKAFSEFIPYLRKLCNITGQKPQEQWRKYIRAIAQKKITTENLMSAREFDKINFSAVPSKAFNLYKKAFAKRGDTKERFAEFIKQVRSNEKKIHVILHPHEILNQYLTGTAGILHNQERDEHPATEAQWKCFTDEALEYKTGINFIPMIDVSGSMFHNEAMPARVALTMGILMSLMNKGVFHRKAITFSSIPITMDITGDTAKDQINSILNVLYKPGHEGGSAFSTNFVAAFEEFLNLCKKNDVSPDIVANTRIVAFSDMQFNAADAYFDNSEFTGVKTPLNAVRELFKDAGYEMPQLIFWNVSGTLNNVPCSFGDTNVATVSGFEPNMINYFMQSGELDPSSIAFNIINEYTPLVQLPEY